MRTRNLAITGLCATLLVGCGGDNDAVKTTPSEGGSSAGGAGGSGGKSAAAGDFLCSDKSKTVQDCDADELFDYKEVPVFELTLPAAQWEALKKNAAEEVYTEAEAAFEGASLGTIGLRFKGGVGTLTECFDSTGALTCSKLSMKLKFNEYETDSRFFGLKKLNLHSMRWDDSHLHDRVAYRLYRDMGIAAPRSSWAQVRVNGETQGLYAMVEQIDGRFTADRWPKAGDENLYKEVMFSFEVASAFAGDATAKAAYEGALGEFRTEAYFTSHLETNEETPNHEALLAFSEALEAAAPNARRAVLEQYMDLDELAKYMAVDDAIWNWDGITAVYTGTDYSWTVAHNFYLYAGPEAAQFTLIPWDMDGAMNPSNGFGNIPHWTQTPADCTKLYPVFGGSSYVLAPGCVPLFQALATDLTQYQAHVAKLLSGAFAEETLIEQIDQDAAFIEAAIAADPLGLSLSSWKTAVTQLKRGIPLLRARLEMLAAGKALSPLALSSTALNDFESLSDFDVLVGPIMMTNPASTAEQSVGKTEPLAGSQDLRIDFEYGNEQAAWDQWLYFSVALAEGSIDTLPLTGIRLTVRADKPRTLRLDVESPAQTATNLGVRNGWDIPVGTTPTEVEVLFADAKVQSWATAEGSDPHDDLNAVLSQVTGLAFHPYCLGRGDTGFLPTGTTDKGWLAIDNVQFF